MVAPLEIRLAVPLPPIHIVNVGVTVLDRRWSMTPEGSHWRLYHSRSQGGRMRLRMVGREQEVPDGVVLLIPPRCRVTATCTGPVDHVYLHLEQVPLPESWVERHAMAPFQVPCQPSWEATFMAVRTAPVGPLPLSVHLGLMTLVPACLAAVVGGLSATARRDLESAHAGMDPLAPALALLERDLAQPLNLAALSRACGLSPTRFAHRFRERLGTSPGRWLQGKRIAAAAQRLVDSDDPLESIALAVGFANRSHFSRVFAQHLGEGPATYRNRRQYDRLHRMGTT